jgi:hypothetical protein
MLWFFLKKQHNIPKILLLSKMALFLGGRTLPLIKKRLLPFFNLGVFTAEKMYQGVGLCSIKKE